MTSDLPLEMAQCPEQSCRGPVTLTVFDSNIWALFNIREHVGRALDSLIFLRLDNPDAIDPCVYHAKPVHNINSEPNSHGNFAVEVVPKVVVPIVLCVY